MELENAIALVLPYRRCRPSCFDFIDIKISQHGFQKSHSTYYFHLSEPTPSGFRLPELSALVGQYSTTKTLGQHM